MYAFEIEDIKKLDIGLVLQWYLMASYMYYIVDKPMFKDDYYDALSVRLLNEFDTFEHNHKYLVTKLDLSAGTLYALKEKDYPSIIKNAARNFADKIKSSKVEEIIC